jgi:hypothetical protein
MGRYGKSPKASKSIDLSLPSFSSGGTLQPSWPQAASKKLCNIARCREKWQSFVLVVPTKCSLGSRHIHCKHFSKALLSPFYILKWNGANDANSEAKKRIVHVYNIMYMSLYVHCVEYSPTKYGYGIVWSVWVIGPDQPIVGAEKKATLAMLNFFLGSRKHGIPKCGTWPWHSLQYWGKIWDTYPCIKLYNTVCQANIWPNWQKLAAFQTLTNTINRPPAEVNRKASIRKEAPSISKILLTHFTTLDGYVWTRSSPACTRTEKP